MCSPRAARGIYDDRAGSMLVAALRAWGFAVPESTVVEDGDPLWAPLFCHEDLPVLPATAS